MNVQHPFLTQAEILDISRAKADWIQTWVNRGHVQLAVQNPGRGNRRLYSACDGVRLAVMARFAAFGVNVDDAAKVANVVAETVIRGGKIQWDDALYFSFTSMHSDIRLRWTNLDGSESLTTLGCRSTGDDDRIWYHSEWWRGTGMVRRRDDGERLIPEERARLARVGFHAEPFLFFPIGELVNGVLLRCGDLWEEVVTE